MAWGFFYAAPGMDVSENEVCCEGNLGNGPNRPLAGKPMLPSQQNPIFHLSIGPVGELGLMIDVENHNGTFLDPVEKTKGMDEDFAVPGIRKFRYRAAGIGENQKSHQSGFNPIMESVGNHGPIKSNPLDGIPQPDRCV